MLRSTILKRISLFFFCNLIVSIGFAWQTPTISSPGNGNSTWTGLGFDWNAVAGSESYEIQLDTTVNFNSTAFQTKIEAYINSSSINADTYEYFSDLYFGKTYYWRVRAWVTGDTSLWSTVQLIQTRDYVNLDTPADSASTWTGLNFDWFSHNGVDFYELQVDTTLNFNSTAFKTKLETYINSSSINADTYEYFSDLYFGKTYYWRVRAINAVDTSSWGTVRVIQTRDYVNLDTPADSASTWTGLSFDWFSHNGVDFYELQVDTTLNFNSTAFKTKLETYVNSSSINADTYEYFSDLYFGETYYWRVRAINAIDTTLWSTVRVIQTRDYVNLDTPADSASTWTGLSFDWFSHNGVDFYELQVDTTLSFNSTAFKTKLETYVNSSSINTDTYEYFSDLYFGETYYWRVRAINAIDTTLWSAVRVIQTRDYVNLTSPNDLAVNQSTAGTGLDWSSHSGIDFYELEWDTTNLFNSGLIQNQLKAYINSSSSNSDTYQNTGALLTNQIYFWRVRAINAVDTSAWASRVFSTGVSISTPEIPTLIAPSNALTGVLNPVNFDWNDAVNAIEYECQYGLDSNFSLYTSNITTVSNLTATGLIVDTVYYWRVRSISGGYYSNWSAIWSFGTQMCTASSGASNPSACNSYTSPSGNYLWTNSGAYLDTLQNTSGCDSVVTINLTILNSTSSTQSVTSCDSYSVPSGDETYSVSGMYMDTIMNINGCDSVMTINVTINNSSTGSETVSACDSYTWAASGNNYTSSGVFTTMLANAAGCDSTVTLNLTISNGNSSSETVSTCNNYTWPADSNTYVNSGTYTAVLTNISGCDSTVTLNLTISDSIFTSETVSACDIYTWPANSTTYSSTGVYSAALISIAGCDSIVTLNLTIGNSNTGSETIAACDSYTWPTDGNTYSSTGTYTITLANATGCDSIVTLNLTINTVDSSITQVGSILTANISGVSYRWLDCDNGNAPISGETNQSFTAPTSGSFAAEVTLNGCVDTSSCYTVVITGIFENDLNLFQVFPNPTSGHIMIKMDDLLSNTRIMIRNNMGQIVSDEVLTTGNKLNFEIEGAPGIYFVTVTTDIGKSVTVKIIKE